MIIKANDNTTLTRIELYGDASITVRNLGDQLELVYVKNGVSCTTYVKQGTKKAGLYANNKKGN